MRLVALLVGTSMLAACGGGSSEIGTAGSPVGQPGIGTADQHTFVNPTKPQTYRAVGVAHNFQYQTELDNITGNSIGQFDQLYAGDATTVRDSGISVNYNPRDAIFELSIVQPLGNVTFSNRFQDPAHRTDFGGTVQPQFGVPDLNAQGIQYLQIASGVTTANFINGRFNLEVSELQPQSVYDRTTFFYQRPGTTTSYVTYAGFCAMSFRPI
ncbi:MAG: hypothetical protein HC843_06240 [Sphingomonadales bacterium]|nr:hypothetical protein [Sphingomonadales bacterium]